MGEKVRLCYNFIVGIRKLIYFVLYFTAGLFVLTYSWLDFFDDDSTFFIFIVANIMGICYLLVGIRHKYNFRTHLSLLSLLTATILWNAGKSSVDTAALLLYSFLLLILAFLALLAGFVGYNKRHA